MKIFKLLINIIIFIIIFSLSIQVENEIDTSLVEQYIEQIMNDSEPDTPFWNTRKPGWDYVDGVVIKGFLELYFNLYNIKYLELAKNFIDYRVYEDGEILGYNKDAYNLDYVNGGKNLITFYEMTKDKKYLKAAAKIYEQVLEQPRTIEGNFWHKKVYTNQVWLDGLYMAQPFYMEYDVLYNNSKNIDDIYNHFSNVYKLMRDNETGLYYHGYDSSKEMDWADKTTGLSQNFWLRSLGWLSMALLDTLTTAGDKGSDKWNELKKMFVELCESMLVFQDDDSGMWWQVPNYPNRGANYLETTGTAMYSYSYLKGFRLGYLKEEKFKESGIKAFEGIVKKYLRYKDGKLSLGGNCSVAGLSKDRDGSFDYYMSEKVVENDAKGIGPLILAYNEITLLK